jgi:hypothetical protein
MWEGHRMNRHPEKDSICSYDAYFLVNVSQRLFECLGLFIPPPLTHLSLLVYVEVQRSARHLEYHIQATQVLNCSSIDLRMLCVCLVLGLA